jgi:DNA-binding MarR family transcriptional regulator
LLCAQLFEAQVLSAGVSGDMRSGDEDPSALPPEEERRLRPAVRLALATWPQIDPVVEAIVSRIGDAERLLDREMKRSLDHVGLTKEEFKVLIALHEGPLSHGELCRRLEVSTGAMTNRLDKLERAELLARTRDPRDRRGVLLTLTDGGRARLDAYIDRGSRRERQLLGGLSAADKRRLSTLLSALLDSLESELDAE